MDPFIIPVNRRRFPYIAVICSYVVCIGIYWLAKGGPDDAPINNNWIAITIYLLVILLYSLVAVLFWADFLYNALNKHSLITIFDEGIDDRSSIFSLGKLEWQDIREVEIKKKLGVNLLLVYLSNPKEYLSGQASWKRFILRRWLKSWGTPVVISQRRLAYDLHVLKAHLEDRKRA